MCSLIAVHGRLVQGYVFVLFGLFWFVVRSFFILFLFFVLPFLCCVFQGGVSDTSVPLLLMFSIAGWLIVSRCRLVPDWLSKTVLSSLRQFCVLVSDLCLCGSQCDVCRETLFFLSAQSTIQLLLSKSSQAQPFFIPIFCCIMPPRHITTPFYEESVASAADVKSTV